MGLCERFHCLPSALLAEDAQLLRLLRVEELGGSRERAQAAAPEAGW